MTGGRKRTSSPVKGKAASTSKELSVCREQVENLYKIYEDLNSAVKKERLESQYQELIAAAGGSEKQKRLASQFITRFVDSFPKLEMAAIGALFDLCEDDDVSIRKQAERDLVTVCKKIPHLVVNVADTLAQILQTENMGELSVVYSSLISLLHIDADRALMGIFAQIRTGEQLVKERCLKFLETKIAALGPEMLTLEFERRLFSEALQSVKALGGNNEFLVLMGILKSTKLSKIDEGRMYFVRIVEALLDIKKDFLAVEESKIAQLLTCSDFVFPYFHELANSAPLFIYYCTRVIPKLTSFDVKFENAYFSVLRMTIDLMRYVDKLEDDQAKLCLESLLQVTNFFLVESPVSEDGIIPDYQFSYLESLFYLIHRLFADHTHLFEEYAQGLENEFRSKVAYLLRAVVAYKMKIVADFKQIEWKDMKKEETKITCLRALVNISDVAKNVFFRRRITESQIRLSWQATSLPSTLEKKRPQQCSHSSDRESEKKLKIYQPPSGKFSDRAGNYDSLKRTNRMTFRRNKFNRY
ncbi:unnamed protein product [Orchesella dallaii]|uniref:Apoptosis inhibitor 5 n=1 Tax=Orchesella dallaii TaxID=48710 RepID=A0ABP1PUU8_9HEXA